jgi:hypothetical protein
VTGSLYGPFLFTNTFMGASGLGQAAGVPIGAPLFPDLNPLYTTDASVGFSGSTDVVRRMQPAAGMESNSTVTNRSDYDSATQANNFSGEMERISHNGAHVYIAGYWGAPPPPFELAKAGDQMFQPYAARDPFFFMLHGKVDELWARWQRKSLLNLDPGTTFGTASGNANIMATMGPWNGTAFGDGLANDTSGQIEPWTLAGGQIYAKPGNDRSVTSPPFYDTAPLTIPAMQPNQEVILEIPWYPPDPSKFGVANPEHVCLLARIETSTASPYGMTVAETSDISFNTQQNNNVAWKNISVIDTFPGAFKIVTFLTRNISREGNEARLTFGAQLNRGGASFFEKGTVRVDLGAELLRRWQAGGRRGRGLEMLPDGQLRINREEAFLEGLSLKPNEAFPVRVTFELNRDYRPTKETERIVYDVVQAGMPGKPDAVVGGQRYEISLAKLTLVKPGIPWRLLPGIRRVSEKWMTPEFDDSRWHERRLDLGFEGIYDNNAIPVTTYLRRTFVLDDPGFFRNLLMKVRRGDGAIVYLNGKAVYQAKLPKEGVTAKTPASVQAAGVERAAYFPVRLDPGLLRPGTNVLAVELHAAANPAGIATPVFDLELDANVESPQASPMVTFSNLSDGQLLTVGRPIAIDLQALDPDGSVRSVEVSIDGKTVVKLDRAPFSYKWAPEPGPHRFTAIVTDSDGLQSQSYLTVTGVKNVPPTVVLTQPAEHMRIAPSDVLQVVARAQDPDGTIQRVDFFVNDSYVFGAPARLVGSARTAPFTLTLRDLKAGHAMITAVAYDNGGARTGSPPIMVMVRDGNPSHPH